MQRADASELAERIVERCAGRELLLLLDFDGTLCEFQADPAAVWLAAERRELLLKLSHVPHVTIGLVSGRRLPDVRLRSGITRDSGFGAGLHGLEIDGPGELFMHPSMADARLRARTIGGALLPLVASLPGTFVEDKDFSIALHFREASPRDQETAAAAFHQVVQPSVAAGEVRIMSGSCVLEVLPRIEWNKGHAVTWIRERLARRHAAAPFTVYAGDDVTDEDAFAVIGDDGLAIAASDRVQGAGHRLDGPPDIERLLAGLLLRLARPAVR